MNIGQLVHEYCESKLAKRDATPADVADMKIEALTKIVQFLADEQDSSDRGDRTRRRIRARKALGI